jgi:hypothetical protein
MENTSMERNTNEEIIEQLVKKVNELEKRKVDIPDYAAQFEELKIWIQQQMPDYTKPLEELARLVIQHNISYPGREIQTQIGELKGIVAKIPKNIPVKHQHYFDPKSKGWVIAGVTLLIVVAVTTGLSVHLFVENRRIEAADVMFRVAKQAYPEVTNEIEDRYAKDPVKMEAKLIELEAEALRKARAQERIDQAEEEIREAKKEMGIKKFGK